MATSPARALGTPFPRGARPPGREGALEEEEGKAGTGAASVTLPFGEKHSCDVLESRLFSGNTLMVVFKHRDKCINLNS